MTLDLEDLQISIAEPWEITAEAIIYLSKSKRMPRLRKLTLTILYGYNVSGITDIPRGKGIF